MKKIVPFNNVLNFNTDVHEITAISLEHKINKNPDMISGVFYISGEYKITEGILDKESFNFELPFDIALSEEYQLDTLMVDVDDFRYDLVADKSLKVNIDLYIDGEIIKEEERNDIYELEEQVEEDDKDKEIEKIDECIEIEQVKITEPEQIEVIEPERIDLLKEMLIQEEDKMEKNDSINENINENVNNNINTDNQEEYVTYRVYTVLEGDTIESIIKKYNLTKEILADYNNLETINKGDKLIIPTNEK